MSMIDELKIKPEPDFSRFERAVRREGEPDRVPFYELFADKPIKDKILGKPTLMPVLIPIGNMEETIKNEVEYWHRTGFDYVPANPVFVFGFKAKITKDTADLTLGTRFWINEECTNSIRTREDFDKYRWPDPQAVGYRFFDMFERHLPDGMKVIGQISGVLENAMWLMGYEGMAYALADDPELLKDVFDKVGSGMLAVTEAMASRGFVGAIQMGDDMGFKTQTMISPAHLRQYVFPWHRKIVEKAHEHSKPIILHSCGNLERIMDDIIESGFEAKHSFEDAIMPVAEVKRKWGDKLAILGGVDVGLLARASVDEVKDYTRKVLRDCMPGGGYALGSGNSVANYIKPENYLAMLEVGFNEGKY